MKLFTQKLIPVLFILLAAALLPGTLQAQCEVLLADIAGEYEGDCKKGIAEGKGKSSGTDSYEGEFKKGLPHGKGKYTWANGDVYEGEFKKGLKDGPGKMLVMLEGGASKEQSGFWKDDAYIGQYAIPYKLQYRSSGVTAVRVNPAKNVDDEGATLYIEIQQKGRTVPNAQFSFDVTNGNILNRLPAGSTTNIRVAVYPLFFSIGYLGESIELEIYQAASWNVVIDLNK